MRPLVRGSLLYTLKPTAPTGAAIGWSGDFKEHTEKEIFSSVIDLVLNCGCFIYIGAWIPFDTFNATQFGITPWRLIILFVAMDQQNEGSVLQIATRDVGTQRSISANISAPSHASQQNDSEQVTSAIGMNQDITEKVITEVSVGYGEAGASGVVRDE